MAGEPAVTSEMAVVLLQHEPAALLVLIPHALQEEDLKA
jgi:hypothetical protein